MFTHIGRKIKAIAQVVCWIQIVLYGIVGLVTFARAGGDGAVGLSLIGLLIIGIGVLLGWLSSAFLYAFGELVDNSEIIAKAYGKKPQNALPNTAAANYPTDPYAGGGYTPHYGGSDDDLPEL